MASRRQLKFGELIRRELSAIFQKDLQFLSGKNIISVNEVSASPDLSVIHISIGFLVDQDKAILFEKIQEHKSEIRKYLGNKIRKDIKKIPDLVFHLDEGAKYSSEINQILENLDIPPQDEIEE